MTRTRTLIVDNNIDQPWRLCPDIRRWLDGEVVVRRAPQCDLPPSPGDFTHVLLTGSKTSILDSSPWVLRLMDFIRATVDERVPLLGVCYGHQLVARTYGGDASVRKSATPEFGWVPILQTGENPVLKGLPERFYSFQFHFEEVSAAPPGFIPSASSPRCPIQAYHVEGKPVFGVQFHPERNAAEGQQSLDVRRKLLPGDCLFNDGRAESFFNENVAVAIFRNFLSQRREG